mmetsp:Transcript_19906/g.52132  ORF Transcript_19906/g.52132 Transcript_19906/m.52132 type:complete len:273 (-) Transcript_19906:100-918(-)
MIGKPYWSERGRTPTALCTLKRPPTQSQKPKTLAGSMPKAAVLSRAELHATTCWRTMLSLSASMPSVSHLRMVRALSMVSAVVKVLDTMTTRVVSGSRPAVARLKSTGSTFARKRSVRPSAAAEAAGSVLRASQRNSGPRYEPPMPTATTVVSGLPVEPSHAPLRTRSLKSAMASSTVCTSATMSTPSTSMGAEPLGARSAGWKTARFSVVLIFSPANMALRRPSTSAARARLSSSSLVSAVAFWREKSNSMSSASTDMAAQRSASATRSFR